MKRSPTLQVEDERVSRGQQSHAEPMEFGPGVRILPNFALDAAHRTGSRKLKRDFGHPAQQFTMVRRIQSNFSMCCTSSAGGSSLRSTPAATADATAGSRCVVAYLFQISRERILMESMHKIVELERIDFATFPTIELDAKLTQSLAQFAIMRDPRPFSNQTFDPFRDFLHVSIGLSG